MILPGQVLHRSNSSNFFLNLENTLCAKHCPVEENNLPANTDWPFP